MLGLGRNYIVKTDQMLINATKNGYKPACLLFSYTGHPKINYKNCDLVSFKQVSKSGEVIYKDYLINKNKVLGIIKNNIALFASRLGMSSESSIEAIYKTIEEKLKTSFQIPDLEGIILGFPKQNSMIYNLEKYAGMGYEDRKDPKTFKIKLLEALQKEDSPYANLDKEEKAELENSIQSIDKIGEFNNPLYEFIKYVDEPSEIDRIKTTTVEYKKGSKLLSRCTPN